jgi:hypothetical protein
MNHVPPAASCASPTAGVHQVIVGRIAEVERRVARHLIGRPVSEIRDAFLRLESGARQTPQSIATVRPERSAPFKTSTNVSSGRLR